MSVEEHNFKNSKQVLDAKRVILSLHFEFKGDFDKIYDFISRNKDCIDVYNKWEKKTAKCVNDYLWFYDDEFPHEIMKKLSRPPFIIKKSNLKTYKFTFRADTEIEVYCADYKTAKVLAAQEFLDIGPDFEATKIIYKRK